MKSFKKIMEEQNPETKKTVRIPSLITVKKFSELLDLPVSQIITELMKNKILATINEEIDFETASIIAQDLEFETEEDLEVSDNEVLTLEKVIDICKKEKESDQNLTVRPPIVTILGHVDHGKTTLLDTIRKSSVATGESGGITQHISAYQVKKRGKLITFIDTPGHEAFSAMRERGVSIADIAILVVAADDGARPQTKEVIKYLKEKKIPTIVAINKIDKPEANLQKVKQELSECGISIEEWGGDVICNEVSAKQNIGIDKLLESILLVTEVGDLRADAKRSGLAVVLESHLDSHKGPVSTVLMKTGTFKVGQDITAGATWGRIKKMEDFTGKNIDGAGPSMPITIIGLNGTPNTNDIVHAVSKKLSSRVKSKMGAEEEVKSNKEVSKKKIYEAIDEKKTKKLNIVIKSDVQGSLEAIEQILSTIKSKEVVIEYIKIGVGNITESDVKIAQSSEAIIFGFNVAATAVAGRMAENSEVEIRTFNIIYELVESVKSAMAQMLPPEIIRTDLGKLKVLAIFKTGKYDMIVGGKVIEGKVIKKSSVEIKRNGEIVGKGTLANLQQNKVNAEEVKQGNECGITFEGDVKIKEGDTLMFYTEEEKERKL